jgi:hypothetical protein
MELLKVFGPLLSAWGLGAAALIGLLLLVPRKTRRAARYWLFALATFYVVLGLPVVANAIADRLPALERTGPTGRLGMLVIFDGDNRRGRLATAIEAIRVHEPRIIWVLADRWVADRLRAAGSGQFRHDGLTQNTRDQIDRVSEFIESHPGEPVAVVVSRLQAPRVAALAAARNLSIAILPSPIDDEPPTGGWRRWVPSYIGFRTSRDALYEHAALWYYGRQGWIE